MTDRENDEHRTPAEVPEPVLSSKDEVTEKVELAEPEATEDPRDYEDQIAEDDDPRLKIAAKHDEINRDFAADSADPEPSELDIEEPTDTIEEAEPEMVAIKVYGDTRMVPKDKVEKAGGIQAYQKQLAVDEGFQRNKMRQEELDQREARLKQWEQDLESKGQQPPATDAAKSAQKGAPTDPPAEGDQSLGDLLHEYHEALLDGDDEKRDSLAVQLHSRNNQAADPIDLNSVIDDVAEKAASKIAEREYGRKARAAIKQLTDSEPRLDRKSADYDPRLYTAVDDETVIVERQNPEWEPEQVVKEAWRRVSEWHGSPQTDSMTDKQAQKRSMSRPAASTGRNQPPPPPPVRTDSSYVENLKRARGQI